MAAETPPKGLPMPHRTAAIVLVTAALAMLMAPAAAWALQPPRGGGETRVVDEIAPGVPVFRRAEVVMEMGLALPRGDLGESFEGTARGYGAEPGYILGLRVRLYLNRNITLAPAFSYTEFGDFDGYDAAGESYKVVSRVLRYGLDLGYTASGSHDQLRPFASLGVAVARNKYREEYSADETYYAAGVNTFQWTVAGGVRWRDFELSLAWEGNTFETARFFPVSSPEDYDWSHLGVRLAYVLPRI